MFAIRHQLTWGGKTWYKDASAWSEILVKTSCIYITDIDKIEDEKLNWGQAGSTVHASMCTVKRKKLMSSFHKALYSLLYSSYYHVIIVQCISHMHVYPLWPQSQDKFHYFLKILFISFSCSSSLPFSPRLLSLFSLFLQSRSPSHWLHFQSIICGVACNCSLILTPLMQQVES